MPQQSGQPLLDQSVQGADGLQGQRIAVQDRSLLDQDPNGGFGPGEDAQSQALAVPEGEDPFAPLEPEGQQPAEEVHQAQVVTAEDIRAWVEEYQSWKQADDLAEPLLDKFVVAQVNGQRFKVPVREAIKGYQMHEDYSNKLRELYKYKQELELRERGMQKLLVDMDDGQRFLDAMVFLGKFNGFAKAAIIYGTQLDAERKMTPEQRRVHAALRAQRAQLQKLEIENRTLRSSVPRPAPQQNGGPNADQVFQVYMQQLQYLVPKVAQKLGFVNSPYASQEFERHFNQMLPSIVGQDLTSEFVETVMRATMESIDRQLQGHAGFVQQRQALNAPAQPAQPAQRNVVNVSPYQRRRPQLPPAGQMPGPSQSAQPQRPKRERIGDFDRSIRGKAMP